MKFRGQRGTGPNTYLASYHDRSSRNKPWPESYLAKDDGPDFQVIVAPIERTKIVTLSTGARLGLYEVIEPIGAGGMGEVYRARDTKLKRDVAIKILPSEFAQDPERLARFKREAQLLASLNHPHIASIYGLEEAEEQPFLVLELIEGEDLSERLKQGPVPMDEALAIARQIADALEGAHEKGIVHRDLKPGNIKLTPDGKVKVLDFGLAKAFAGESKDGSSADLSQSPTMTRLRQDSGGQAGGQVRATAAGVILGTAAYMSPEQARGKTVDKRTDIWAFGVVFYEMLTGRQLYSGETLSDTLAAILKTDPDWEKLPADTPWLLKRLLKRCLEKDPRQRLHDMADARLEIEDSIAGPPEVVGTPTAAAPAARWKTILSWSIAAVAVLLLTSLVLRGDGSTPAPQVSRFELPVKVDGRSDRAFALSPDDSSLVFAGGSSGNYQLHLRPLDQVEAIPLRGTEGSWTHFFSPDGKWVGFVTDSGLFKMSLADGTALEVLDHSDLTLGGCWGPGDWIVLGGAAGLSLVSADGGVVKELTRIEPGNDEAGHGWPRLVPGGNAVVFTRWTRGGIDEGAIEAVRLDTGERRVVVENGTGALVVPTGHLLFARDGAILAAPFDLERLEVTGAAVRVIGNVQVGNGVPKIAFSDTGVLVYATPRTAKLVWMDREGREEDITNIPRNYLNPRLSPDGHLLAVEADGHMWILDLRRDTFSLLTSTPAYSASPLWTPDGKGIVYSDGENIAWMPADRSGPSEIIAEHRSRKVPSSLSPDGSETAVLVYTESSADIYIFPTRGGGEPRPFLDSPAYEGGPQFSPDGRFMAYVSDESGRLEVYVTPYPGPGAKWQVSTEGGTHPLWNPNGRELFYRNGEKIMRVSTGAAPELTPSKPELVIEKAYAFGGNLTLANYDVTSDGQRFVMVKEEPDSEAVIVVLNWFEELNELVPTN